MSSGEIERLQTELKLIEAMYPGQVAFNGKAREMKYSSDQGAFQLRLPDGYLVDQVPEVLSANSGRIDLRERLKQHVQSCNPGEEVLDSVISMYNDLSESHAQKEHANVDGKVDSQDSQAVNEEGLKKSTMVIWLHHLLATTKRKQALDPPSPDVSGVTKPGYPGVLVYSGPAKAVHEHVNALKQLNWQAFQVRLDTDEFWSFGHGSGVKEVETMKEIVLEIGEEKRNSFMEAMRMK